MEEKADEPAEEARKRHVRCAPSLPKFRFVFDPCHFAIVGAPTLYIVFIR